MKDFKTMAHRIKLNEFYHDLKFLKDYSNSLFITNYFFKIHSFIN